MRCSKTDRASSRVDKARVQEVFGHLLRTVSDEEHRAALKLLPTLPEHLALREK
jgi:hypothetical protein